MSPLRTQPKPPEKKNTAYIEAGIGSVLGVFLGLLGIGCLCGAYYTNRRILAGPQRSFRHYFAVMVVSLFFLGVYLVVGGALELSTRPELRKQLSDAMEGKRPTQGSTGQLAYLRKKLETEFPGLHTAADFAAAEAAASARKGPDQIRVYTNTLNERIMNR